MNRHLPNYPANNFTIVCFYLQAHTNRQHGGVLYEIMEKPFTVSRTAICYEEKFFVPVTNTENGEVNDRTLTDTGHQKNDIIIPTTSNFFDIPAFPFHQQYPEYIAAHL